VKKRVIAMVLIIVMALSLCVPAAAANIRTVQTDITYRGISIVINGVEIAPCDEKGNSTEPFIMNDTTYLPVRAIAGALGLNVGWEPSTSTVVLESGGEANYGNGNPSASFDVKHVSITYRGTNISLDGENIPLVNRNGESVEPFIYNGTNYLPLRVVSEALGLSVGWDGATSTVTLKGSQPDPDPDPEPDPDPDPDPEPDPEPTPPTPAELVTMPAGTLFKGGKTGGTMSLILDLRYEYDDIGRIARVYTTGGQVDMKCSYDERGNLTQLYYKVPGEEMDMAWRYNSDNEPVAYYEGGVLVEGAYYEYDAEGRLVEEEFINENNTMVNYKYSYNDKGQLETMREKMQWHEEISYSYSYDELGRVKQEKADHGYGIVKYKDYEYAEDGGCVVTEREPVSDGGEAVPVRELRLYTDNEGRLVEENYDLHNDRFESRIVTTLDERGNVVAAKETFSTSFYFWEKGNMFVEEGYVNEYEWKYDEADRLIFYKEDKYGTTMDGGTGELSFGYSEGKEESYSYTSDGQPLSYTRKSFAMLTDDGVNYAKVQNGAGETDYDYDAQGRLVKSVENRYVFGYFEGEGTVLKLSSILEKVYIYDAQGRLVKDYIREVDSEGKGLSYIENYVSYDEQGRIIAQKDSGDGSVITTMSFNYDAAGNLTYEGFSQNQGGNIQSYEIKNSYDYKGQLAKMVYTDSAGNNITEVYTYDNLGRLYYYTTAENGAYSTTSISFNAEDLPQQSITKSSTDGTTISCDYSYVKVPKTETNEYVEMMLAQIESLL